MSTPIVWWSQLFCLSFCAFTLFQAIATISQSGFMSQPGFQNQGRLLNYVNDVMDQARAHRIVHYTCSCCANNNNNNRNIPQNAAPCIPREDFTSHLFFKTNAWKGLMPTIFSFNSMPPGVLEAFQSPMRGVYSLHTVNRKSTTGLELVDGFVVDDLQATVIGNLEELPELKAIKIKLSSNGIECSIYQIYTVPGNSYLAYQALNETLAKDKTNCVMVVGSLGSHKSISTQLPDFENGLIRAGWGPLPINRMPTTAAETQNTNLIFRAPNLELQRGFVLESVTIAQDRPITFDFVPKSPLNYRHA